MCLDKGLFAFRWAPSCTASTPTTAVRPTMTISSSSLLMTQKWSDSSPRVMRQPTERRSWSWQSGVQRITLLRTPRKPERSSLTSGSTAPPSPSLHQRRVYGEGPHLQVSRCPHLCQHFLDRKHQSSLRKGSAVATLPESHQDGQTKHQPAADLLQLSHREPADILYHSVVWQLHCCRQGEAPESSKSHTEDHWLPFPLPDGHLHLLLPQQS